MMFPVFFSKHFSITPSLHGRILQVQTQRHELSDILITPWESALPAAVIQCETHHF